MVLEVRSRLSLCIYRVFLRIFRRRMLHPAYKDIPDWEIGSISSRFVSPRSFSWEEDKQPHSQNGWKSSLTEKTIAELAACFRCYTIALFPTNWRQKKKQLATYTRKHYAQENNESSYIAGFRCKAHNNPIKISVHIRTG